MNIGPDRDERTELDDPWAELTDSWGDDGSFADNIFGDGGTSEELSSWPPADLGDDWPVLGRERVDPASVVREPWQWRLRWFAWDIEWPRFAKPCLFAALIAIGVISGGLMLGSLTHGSGPSRPQAPASTPVDHQRSGRASRPARVAKPAHPVRRARRVHLVRVSAHPRVKRPVKARHVGRRPPVRRAVSVHRRLVADRSVRPRRRARQAAASPMAGPPNLATVPVATPAPVGVTSSPTEPPSSTPTPAPTPTPTEPTEPATRATPGTPTTERAPTRTASPAVPSRARRNTTKTTSTVGSEFNFEQ